jgi:hypothetical protein
MQYISLIQLQTHGFKIQMGYQKNKITFKNNKPKYLMLLQLQFTHGDRCKCPHAKKSENVSRDLFIQKSPLP